MHALDVKLFAALYGGAQGPWIRTMLGLTILGSGWTALVLLPLLAWPRTRSVVQSLAIAVVAQGVWVWNLKHVVGRVRPWMALGYPPPFGAPHDGSFPSGHASGSFCVATFLVVAFPAMWPSDVWRGRVVPGAAVAIAMLIGVSRVYIGAHYPSDVLGGALTGAWFGGAAGGLYLESRLQRRRPHEAPATPVGRWPV